MEGLEVFFKEMKINISNNCEVPDHFDQFKLNLKICLLNNFAKQMCKNQRISECDFLGGLFPDVSKESVIIIKKYFTEKLLKCFK